MPCSAPLSAKSPQMGEATAIEVKSASVPNGKRATYALMRAPPRSKVADSDDEDDDEDGNEGEISTSKGVSPLIAMELAIFREADSRSTPEERNSGVIPDPLKYYATLFGSKPLQVRVGEGVSGVYDWTVLLFFARLFVTFPPSYPPFLFQGQGHTQGISGPLRRVPALLHSRCPRGRVFHLHFPRAR